MKGITVILHTRVQTGTDLFGAPIYEEVPETVENVLVSPSSSQEIVNTTELYGRKAVYTLAIPKGDTHVWENQIVEFFGEAWRVFGIPTKGIDSLVPTAWNTKVTVDRYDG